MFNLFCSPAILDPGLGKFTRKHGMWRGFLPYLDNMVVPLILAGSKKEPNSKAIELAKSIPSKYIRWKTIIEQELIAHLAPYQETVASEECLDQEFPLPIINKPNDIWSYVIISYVAISSLDGQLVIEVGYNVTWDEEHTLGARFKNDQFIELCGSVLCP